MSKEIKFDNIWPWDNFPEDLSTWEHCKSEFIAARLKLQVAEKALEFYAKDNHIRDYEGDQMVILEMSECDDENPNVAEQALAKLRSE